ncbi:MAG: dihydroxyacetone kinase subunit L [Spirochaetaceae bacterium]|nr:MAG: dihydroxyacetone kinase subunit L [Spirochaetaceae bacterium]
MKEQFANQDGQVVVRELIKIIQENRAYLSEVDGAIGDGDHGINMAKGFTMTAERLSQEMDLSESLKTLGRTLVMEIGGAMGPLYGSFFKALARACRGHEQLDAHVFGRMLEAGWCAVIELGQAKVGDKTLVDTLHPALEAYNAAVSAGSDFREALRSMTEAAERGKESTRQLVAKVGRASRLGERSRGVLDAGAVSCHLILDSMARTIQGLL